MASVGIFPESPQAMDGRLNPHHGGSLWVHRCGQRGQILPKQSDPLANVFGKLASVEGLRNGGHWASRDIPLVDPW